MPDYWPKHVGADTTIKIHHKIKQHLLVIDTLYASNRSTEYRTYWNIRNQVYFCGHNTLQAIRHHFLESIHVQNVTMMLTTTTTHHRTSNMLYPGVTRQLNTDTTCGAWQQVVQCWAGWWLTAQHWEGSDQGLSVIYAINPLGPLYFTLVTLCTARFNIKKFYILVTQYIYVFCVALRRNCNYFPIQH
jgi:hypothetical protein